MTQDVKTKKTKASLNKLPCQQCMNYIINDLYHQLKKENKEKAEMLNKLNHIKNPEIHKIMSDLLKIMGLA